MSAERVLCARMEADVDLVGGHVQSCLVSCPVAVGRRLTVQYRQRLSLSILDTNGAAFHNTGKRAGLSDFKAPETRVLFKTFVTLPTDVGKSVSQRRKPRAYPLPPPPLSAPSVVVRAGGLCFPCCSQLPVSLTTQLDDQLSERSLGRLPATARRRCNGSGRLPRLRHRQQSVRRLRSPMPIQPAARHLYWTAAGEVVYCPDFFRSLCLIFFVFFCFSDFFWLLCTCANGRTRRRGGALREQQRAHFDLRVYHCKEAKPKVERTGGEGPCGSSREPTSAYLYHEDKNKTKNEKEGRGSIEPRTQDQTHIRTKLISDPAHIRTQP